MPREGCSIFCAAMIRVATVLFVLFTAFSSSAGDWLTGKWDAAEKKLDREIAAARKKRDRVTEARLLATRASFLLDRSSYHKLDPDRAKSAIVDARAAAEASGDRLALANAIHADARWNYWQKLDQEKGEWPAIDQTIHEALRMRGEIADKPGLSDSWFYRGLVRQMQEDYVPARKAFETALHYAKDPLARSFAERHLGYVYQVNHDLENARKLYVASLDHRLEAGADVLVPFAMNLLADFELETTKDREAAKKLLLDSAMIARGALSWRAANAAETKLVELDPDDARAHAKRALDAAEKYGDPKMIAAAKKLQR